MKKFWSKCVWIALFALSNLVWGAYVVIEKGNLRSWKDLFGLQKPPPVKANTAVAKKGQVVPAAHFKDDHELQACYEALLAREPQVQEGTVHFHMTINEHGDINYLKLIHTDLDDPEFTDCVMEKVQAKRLPATKDRIGVVISHKFNFKKREQAALEFQ